MLSSANALHQKLIQLNSTLEAEKTTHHTHLFKFISEVGDPADILDAMAEAENQAEIASLCGLMRKYQTNITYKAELYLQYLKSLIEEWKAHTTPDLEQVLQAESDTILGIVQTKRALDAEIYALEIQIKHLSTTSPSPLKDLKLAKEALADAQVLELEAKNTHRYIAAIFEIEFNIETLIKELNGCYSNVLPRLNNLIPSAKSKQPVPRRKKEEWNDIDDHFEARLSLATPAVNYTNDLSALDEVAFAQEFTQTLTLQHDAQRMQQAPLLAQASQDDRLEKKQSQVLKPS